MEILVKIESGHKPESTNILPKTLVTYRCFDNRYQRKIVSTEPAEKSANNTKNMIFFGNDDYYITFH